ncbi:hypothetical protein CEXT_281141 [Caerostris extrusa]|uniref:Uncharacterized protein n=1 Tax=Caerostris extrusa TaxID=172846 RepID=A0AAV4Q5W1_CAEEX|nr:hypothetical protein CEXT_281141 [Caerostris extrusa]
MILNYNYCINPTKFVLFFDTHENQRRIFQYLEEITEEIEETILLASNVFYYLQQAVYRHTELHPAELTTYGPCVRSRSSIILLNRLREHRKIIEHLTEMYQMTVCEAKNCSHPTLLRGLEKDIKWEIREILDKVLYTELLIDRYQIKLKFR